MLPSGFVPLLLAFAPLFRARVWERAQLLLLGAILAPGQRTVCSVLRVVGLAFETHFQNYHRVLNRARWNSRATSRILLAQVRHERGKNRPNPFRISLGSGRVYTTFAIKLK